MKPRKKRVFILNYEKKTAITASIIISFILAFIMLSSSIYYTSSLYKHTGVRMGEIITLESILTLLINTVLFYFLFRLQFWAVNRFINKPYKMWLLLLGLFIVLILFSPFLSQMQWWWFRD